MINKDYALANRRRSARSLMNKFSPEKIDLLAEIGDYLNQRKQIGASSLEALNELKRDTRYTDFLNQEGKTITPYQFETAYRLQTNSIDGIKPARTENTKVAKEFFAKSLDEQVEKEQLMEYALNSGIALEELPYRNLTLPSREY